MTTLVDHALNYAAIGWRVFPCNPRTKKPLTEHGFKDASTDPAVIKAWWRQFPKAMIGIATGASGLDVLDVDVDKAKGLDGEASLRTLLNGHTLPADGTVARTPRGGRHLYFAAGDVVVHNTAGKLGPGLDTRGVGGYVIVPPSVNSDGVAYRWEPWGVFHPAPPWLAPKPEPRRQDWKPDPKASDERKRAYGDKALADECARIATAGEGTRNATLFESACAVFELVKGDCIAKGRAWSELEAAAGAAGLTAREVRVTLDSAWARVEPRAPPERPQANDPLPSGRTGAPATTTAEPVGVADFVAYMPQHSYIFRASGEMWPAASVNARIRPIEVGTNDKGDPVKIPASAWLDRHQPVEQMTWAPGRPSEIQNQLVTAGGWIDRPGCAVFNLYRPPTLRARPGDASKWVDHLKKIYPDDASHLINWLAHRVQFPSEKINHAIVLGGAQGIGKDTLLEPVKRAVGPWNFAEVSPSQLLGRFNGFLKSVILRVSEARDLGDVNRFTFYDHLKVFTAAPPDVLRIDEKNIREYSVFNVCGVILTTNHKTDGLYLPPDDRRHFVAWSDATRVDFLTDYWTKIYHWYAHGGCQLVAHHLAEHDLTEFDPKAPPPQTAGFWEIVDAGHAPENAELLTVLEEKLKWPAAVTIATIKVNSPDRTLIDWLDDRKNRKQIPHRLEDCGYVRVHNPDSGQGLWTIGGMKQAVYGRSNLPLRERVQAARDLA